MPYIKKEALNKTIRAVLLTYEKHRYKSTPYLQRVPINSGLKNPLNTVNRCACTLKVFK
jgi:hypothetical protein